MLASMSIFVFEFIEYDPFVEGVSRNFFFEIIFYGMIMPLSTGLSLSALAASRSELVWSKYYQNLSDNLAIQLQEIHNEDELARVFAQFMSVLMPLVGAVMYKFCQETHSFQIIFSWSLNKEADLTETPFECWDGMCPFKPTQDANELIIHPCANSKKVETQNSTNCYCLPIIFANNPLAGARLYLAQDSELSEDHNRLVREITFIIASAFHRIQLEHLMKKRDDILHAESQRLARDVHDSLGHSLAYLRLRLDQMSMESSQAGMSKLYKEVESLRDVAKDAYDQMRAVLVSLTPDSVSDIGSTLIHYADRIGQRANFEIIASQTGQPYKMEPLVQRNIFYIFQEILTNIEKHAHARRVNIHLNWLQDQLEVEVHDDGVGFDPSLPIPDGHFGLKNIRERALESNAQLTISSIRNSGTCIHLYVPYEASK